MSMLAKERIKLVGDVLPYVFIESVSLDSLDSLRSEENTAVGDTTPVFSKNEFGTNKLVVSSSLQDEDQGSPFRATIKLSVNDFLKNSTWFNTPVRSLMSIKLFYATSQEAFNIIKNPSFKHIKQAPGNLRDHIGEETLKIPMSKDLGYYKTREVQTVDDILCTVKLKKTLRLKTNYLALVAFAFTEAPDLHGTRAIRGVLKEGRLEGRSVTYYNPDGSVWSGPVHIHPDKGVMAGRAHNNIKHDLLDTV